MRDDRVMYILLLLAEEVRTDAIEGVAAQLVVALQDLQDVENDAPLCVDGLGLALAERLG